MNNTNPKDEIPNNTNLAEKLTISTKNNFKYRYLSRDQLLYADYLYICIKEEDARYSHYKNAYTIEKKF